MIGDVRDISGRLRAVLPGQWFQDNSPNLTALLACLATPWCWLYGQIQNVKQQARLASASDQWLDLIALDFFGTRLERREAELDDAYRARIQWAMLQSSSTRLAVVAGMTHLTGAPPKIFEPSNAADTGAYGTGAIGSTQSTYGLAYCVQGGWGNLLLPYQFFTTIRRPRIEGVSLVAGYGAPAGGYGVGVIAYIDLAMLVGNISDSDIASSLTSILPVNATAWLRLM